VLRRGGVPLMAALLEQAPLPLGRSVTDPAPTRPTRTRPPALVAQPA
jgi:hypothetical protein